ncbi:hypothetical protein Tco_1231528 [Tanacetum coccineum]
MERMISKEEVKRAVWDCGVDKSPGPDGFSFSSPPTPPFFRHLWPVIENDVFETVDYLVMLWCLIGSYYKIIANLCESGLVGVVGDLVIETSFSIWSKSWGYYVKEASLERSGGQGVTRLSRWEDETSFNERGRLTLLKFVFGSMPIFHYVFVRFHRDYSPFEAGGYGEERTRGYGSTIGMKRCIKELVPTLLRKISSCGNIDYSDVNSYEGMETFVGFLFGFNPNSKAVLRVLLMVCGGICETFATSFCLIRRSLKRR